MLVKMSCSCQVEDLGCYFSPVYRHLINTRHLLDTVPWVGYFPHTASLKAPLGDYKLLLYRQFLYLHYFYLFFFPIVLTVAVWGLQRCTFCGSHITFLSGLIWGLTAHFNL